MCCSWHNWRGTKKVFVFLHLLAYEVSPSKGPMGSIGRAVTLALYCKSCWNMVWMWALDQRLRIVSKGLPYNTLAKVISKYLVKNIVILHFVAQLKRWSVVLPQWWYRYHDKANFNLLCEMWPNLRQNFWFKWNYSVGCFIPASVRDSFQYSQMHFIRHQLSVAKGGDDWKQQEMGFWKKWNSWEDESLFPPLVSVSCFSALGDRKEEAETKNGEGGGGFICWDSSSSVQERHMRKNTFLHGKDISSMWWRLAAMHAPRNLPPSIICFPLFLPSKSSWCHASLLSSKMNKRGNPRVHWCKQGPPSNNPTLTQIKKSKALQGWGLTAWHIRLWVRHIFDSV